MTSGQFSEGRPRSHINHSEVNLACKYIEGVTGLSHFDRRVNYLPYKQPNLSHSTNTHIPVISF